MPTTLPCTGLVDPATGTGVTVASLASVVKSIKFSITTTTASSTETIPANARVIRTDINVTTPYEGGTTPDIVVGFTGSTSAYMASNDHAGSAGLAAPAAPAFYPKLQSTASDTVLRAVLATVSGGPTSGGADIEVFYCSPAA